MNISESALLLTIGRILRARIKEDTHDPSGNNEQDYLDLCEALRPFEDVPVVTFGEVNVGDNAEPMPDKWS